MHKILTKILAAIYSTLIRARNWSYDKGIIKAYNSSIPVISIGNITAGGNGKTPLCCYIASELKHKGARPVILSRGYGGKISGPHLVTTNDSPNLVGDEPLLLATKAEVPVYISRSRIKGIKKIQDDKAGDIVILDDGFQHRALGRDLDIVTQFIGTHEAVQDFIEGKMLPEGMFREQRDQALKRVDILMLSERRTLSIGESLPHLNSDLLKLIPPTVKIFRSYLELPKVCMINSGEQLTPREVVAFCGLAQPEGFFESLKSCGFTLHATHPFKDHQQFSESDIENLNALYPKYPLVCTEKDSVKIRLLSEKVCERCAVFHAQLRITPSDAFVVQIMRKITTRIRK